MEGSNSDPHSPAATFSDEEADSAHFGGAVELGLLPAGTGLDSFGGRLQAEQDYVAEVRVEAGVSDSEAGALSKAGLVVP